MTPSSNPAARGLPFAKGHGTENDFVLLPDPDGELDLPPALIRRLCDRRAGIGADGILRVVRTETCAEVAELAGEAGWFMDYRNADGSVAEMCGNGARVYARYLVERGWAEPGELRLATRHGVRDLVVVADGNVTVDMGTPVSGEQPVEVLLGSRPLAAYPVDLGNPHAVALIDDPIDNLDLTTPLVLPPDRFPAGANLEVVNLQGPGRLRMRVVERGVGETRSCGTGACAAAAVATAVLAATGAARDGATPGTPGRAGARSRDGAAAGAGAGTPGRAEADARDGAPPSWVVDVPGGRLTVSWAGDRLQLTGPAVLVASGELTPEWVAQARADAALLP